MVLHVITDPAVAHIASGQVELNITSDPTVLHLILDPDILNVTSDPSVYMSPVTRKYNISLMTRSYHT